MVNKEWKKGLIASKVAVVIIVLLCVVLLYDYMSQNDFKIREEFKYSDIGGHVQQYINGSSEYIEGKPAELDYKLKELNEIRLLLFTGFSIMLFYFFCEHKYDKKDSMVSWINNLLKKMEKSSDYDDEHKEDLK